MEALNDLRQDIDALDAQLAALYRRRMDEWEMFLTGDYNVHPYNGGAGMTGDFAVPVKADREDPEKYKSDWRYLGAGNWMSTG